MKLLRWMKLSIIFVGIVSLSAHVLLAQPQEAKNGGNIYTKWITLALLGKNQSEIEFYFRNEKEAAVERVKERIRFTVLENLRRSGIRKMIDGISDADDINVIVDKILIEIRFAGLEHDRDLRLSIKEEFGLELENL